MKGYGSAIDLDTARNLVDMGNHPRAGSQLEGAVAIHNILQREGVAYLADEVGLGKTYVALAAMGMFRHFNPDFRILVIAPKKTIQSKWRTDHQTFVRDNWKIHDLRFKGAGGGPARPAVASERLSDLAYETAVDGDRDFFARLPSFSFALNMERSKVASNIERALPWVNTSTMPDLSTIRGRDFVSQAYNAALPRFDLVIIDEAHNLAGGIQIAENGEVGRNALRNAVLAQVLGHPDVGPLPQFASTYRPIADRVLLLSATPVETSFRSMWNQVHLVGKHRPEGLTDLQGLKDKDDARAIEAAKRILVRRINAISVNGKLLTKNLYRQTWYEGGVATFDEAMPRGSARQQLTVGLVQKKVADLIGAKYDNNFQMGMLASFESFAQTVLKEPQTAVDPEHESDEDSPRSNFDSANQADTSEERAGVDVDLVNNLLKSHVDKFGTEMAHPKMDGLVDSLASSWDDGSKALVFVRRIASVLEIKRKLDERYDDWIFARLERDLPEDVWCQIDLLKVKYVEERLNHGRTATNFGGSNDEGGSDTFFSWFFRGNGPKDLSFESGASIAAKLDRAAGGAANAFAQHRVCALLACPPSEAPAGVCALLGLSLDEAMRKIREHASWYMPANAGRGHRFDAVQLATVELLSETDGPTGTNARRLIQSLSPRRQVQQSGVAVDPESELATETFFTRLRAHSELVHLTSPSSDVVEQDFADSLVRASARLGRAHIDVYVAFMRAAGTRMLPADSPEIADSALRHLVEILDDQRSRGDRSGAYWELSQLVEHVALIRNKNLPDTLAEGFLLNDLSGELSTLLGAQRPTVGMHGGVNATAVRQFRMPGYPNVVICTDVLQEGVDLHLFCDRVIHYGVAWTPSAMEQRTGRVDRLFSLAERRFNEIDKLTRDLDDAEKIQVQVPYLPDTIEVLQARRVFDQMGRFTSLMHEGAEPTTKRLDVGVDIARTGWKPPRIEAALKTGFEVLDRDLASRTRLPAVPTDRIEEWWSRLIGFVNHPDNRDLVADHEENPDLRVVYAWRQLDARVQPFSLRLTSRGSLPLVQAMSPVGLVGPEELSRVLEAPTGVLDRVTLSDGVREREYDLAIEGDVILGAPEADGARIRALLSRITVGADDMEQTLTRGDLSIRDVRRTMGRDSREP